MSIDVVSKRDGIAGEYIGRPSPLGNPFIIGTDGDREAVIAKYRTWLWEQYHAHAAGNANSAWDELERLTEQYEQNNHSLVLVCWCAPKACHGDVIKQAIGWWSVTR